MGDICYDSQHAEKRQKASRMSGILRDKIAAGLIVHEVDGTCRSCEENSGELDSILRRELLPSLSNNF